MTKDELKTRVSKVLARARQHWRRFAVCPSYLEDSNYKLSETWLREFKPSDSAQGYDKGLTYAWRRFDEVTASSETLDKKADNVMRNAGLVAGLLGLAINAVHVGHPWLLIPSLIAFVVSLVLAAIACNPTGGATTASVQDLLDDITSGHANDAWIAASISCAVAGRNVTNNWKAERIRWATYAFCAGLILFVVPVIATWLF
jgi:hypothetical protein